MKNIAKFLFFLALISAAGNARAASFNFSLALPAEVLVTQDLDARDALNRPVPHSSAQVQLVELWSRSLNRMVLNSLTPLRIKTLALLNSAWDGFAGFFRTPSGAVFQPIRTWVNAKKTQFKFAAQVSSAISLPTLRSAFARECGDAFFYLIHFVISSTRLLR